MSEDEEWRTVEDFPEYLVSDSGKVASRKWGKWRLLNPTTKKGYPTVTLTSEGQSRWVSVHKLVAAAFLGSCPDGLQVRHLDGVRTNNRVNNLAYGTASENAHDKVRHGTHPHAIKTHCPQNHPYSPDNTYIRPGDGCRMCRTCRAGVRA